MTPQPDRESVRRRNHVTRTGSGPVVVLSHGFGCDQNVFSRLVPLLSDECTVVTFDHVGAGRSETESYDPVRYAALDGYAADIVEVCRSVHDGPVTLVGHSIAAMMALNAAVLAPRTVASTVLLAPSPRYVDDPADGYVGGFSAEDVAQIFDGVEANYLSWSAAMGPVVMGNADRPELADELVASFTRTDPVIARQLARVTFLTDARALLPRVTVPTLVVQCADDALAPPHVGAYVHSRISGSTLVHLDATGHIPQVSAPEETAETILAWLRAHRG